MNWFKFLTNKNISKSPVMMDIRWIFCNHMSRKYGGINTWDREKWERYLLDSDWASYSILDMLKIFITERHTRKDIIELLVEQYD